MTDHAPSVAAPATREADTTCPNCGNTEVKFHTRQYDCRVCRPLGYVYPVGTDIDREDHRHYSCRNGHRWADPR